jgi:hypothetical protein
VGFDRNKVDRWFLTWGACGPKSIVWEALSCCVAYRFKTHSVREGRAPEMRNPLKLNTLQGTALVMMLWFGLLFYGVEGIVTPVRPENGLWFWIALGLWVQLPALYLMDLFRKRWVKFYAILVGLLWGFVQISHHIHGIVARDNPVTLSRYYTYYDTFYLVGPFNNGFVLDLYLFLLDLMILALVWIGVKRVLVRAYY